MTKKDYDAIAEILNVARHSADYWSDGGGRVMWVRIVNALATKMKEDNPRFDRERWNTTVMRGRTLPAD